MEKLSIIIPCFNCEQTLEEAVDSIYSQKEPVIPFDVTMVDDGSTDTTFKIMEKLSQKYPNIKLVQHETNLGGGAARNTAVEHSDGDIIFCLDSDDILGKDFLFNITNFWLDKRCDGVGKSKSVMFNGTNIEDISYVIDHENAVKNINIKSFFEPGNICPLSVTFLITRNAFDRIGGYPTNHGFDTQGLGFRFLSHGLKALICPNTTYYHRVKFSQSYYLREAKKGKKNLNFIKIIDEFIYLFRDEIKRLILDTDLFQSPGNPAPENIYVMLVEKRDLLFRNNFQKFIRLGPSGSAKLLKKSDNPYDQYWLGNYEAQNNKPALALQHYTSALQLGFNHRPIYIKIIQQAKTISNYQNNIVDLLQELTNYYENPYNNNQDNLRNLGGRFLSLLWKKLKKFLYKNKFLKFCGGILYKFFVILKKGFLKLDSSKKKNEKVENKS